MRFAGISKVVVPVVAAVFGAAGGAVAEEGHFDALIFQDAGKVQVGGIDVACFSGLEAPPCDPNGVSENIFEAELLETGTSPGLFGAAEEPGFFAVPDTATSALPYGNPLGANKTHSFDIILAPNSPVAGASILFWDGTGPVSWSGVPASEFFDIEGNAGTGGTLTGTGTLTGIALDSTASNGSFDTHPDFFLNGSGGADPTIGFYTLFGVTRIEGLAPSNPWGVVYDFGVENEALHEAAVENVAGFIPEPATGTMLMLGLAGLAFHRRRGVRANA